MLSQLTILGMTGYILLTLTALGYIMDRRYGTVHVLIDICSNSGEKKVAMSVVPRIGVETLHRVVRFSTWIVDKKTNKLLSVVMNI